MDKLRACESFKQKKYQKALEETFLKLEEEIRTDEGMVGNVGSTATAVILTPTQIFCSNVGDSTAVLSRGGYILPLSVDHKATLSSEQARINSAGLRVIEGRVSGKLAVSRAIGDFDYKGKAGEQKE